MKVVNSQTGRNIYISSNGITVIKNEQSNTKVQFDMSESESFDIKGV